MSRKREDAVLLLNLPVVNASADKGVFGGGGANSGCTPDMRRRSWISTRCELRRLVMLVTTGCEFQRCTGCGTALPGVDARSRNARYAGLL